MIIRHLNFKNKKMAPRKRKSERAAPDDNLQVDSSDRKTEEPDSKKRSNWKICIFVVIIFGLSIYVAYILHPVNMSGLNGRNDADAKTSVSDGSQTMKSSNAPKSKTSPRPSSVTSEEGTNEIRLLRKAVPENDPDHEYAAKIVVADLLLHSRKFLEALEKFDSILSQSPRSPRAWLGRGLALEELAEIEQSNNRLDACIIAYKTVGFELEKVNTDIKVMALERLADRAAFRGKQKLSVKASEELYHVTPRNHAIAKSLGVNYLMTGMNDKALLHFRKVLEKWPDDDFSKAHVGFILYKNENYKEALPYLLSGINQDPEIRKMPKFFVYTGDTLMRLHRGEEAYDVYREAVKIGLFPNIWQRSPYNEPNLRGQPWWTPKETGYDKTIKRLVNEWEVIRNEGLAVLNRTSGGFQIEDENLREKGDWYQFTLYSQGRKDKRNCQRTPKTCDLIDTFPEAASCKRGQVKFSVMHPGTHVWPHTGPTNCRLRMHIGLVIPEGVSIRVTNEIRGWEEGEAFIFDDSFEHEVWHNGTEARLVLIVDMWHPDIPINRRRMLSPI